MRLPCKRPTRRRHTVSLFSRKNPLLRVFLAYEQQTFLLQVFFLIVRVISFPWDIHGNENEKVSIRKTGYGISREKGGKHAGSIAGNKLERERA